MKMIICARRNPALTREQFFHHLRHIHWPMVRDFPSVAASLRGYVQNHAHGDASPTGVAAPCRVETGRDSVIELHFDSDAGVARLVGTPEYIEHVRPDEARFNDLSSNIMVKCREEIVFATGRPGRCKRFDFLAMNQATGSGDFRKTLQAHATRLSLDPVHTAIIDCYAHNWPIGSEEPGSQGFGSGAFDCVRTIWAHSVEGLVMASTLGEAAPMIDYAKSFSVFATEFTMIPATD